jgi:phage terminase small subunit
MPPLKHYRQERFCQELVRTANGPLDRNARIQAYQKAGYQGKTRASGKFGADSSICALLKNKNVAARIQELQERIAHKVEITAAQVINELGRIALSDIRKVIGPNGAILDPREFDDDTAGAIAGIETEKVYEGHGKDRKFVGYAQKLKLWDKNTALGNLAKHFKLLGDDAANAGATYNTQIIFHMPDNGRTRPHEVSNGNGSGNGSGH